MPLVLADRVRDTTTTTGTGTVTLSGTAPTGYQSFAVIGNGNTTYYTINAGSQWEVGIGTYSSTGPTLARNTVLESSNSNALVDFAAGTKDVFVTYPADEAVYQDGATIAAGTAVLGVANGGTGVTTSTGTSSVVLSNSPTLVTPTLGAASATSIAAGLGAVGTPAYTFTGDLNTGMWSPAADTIAFSEGGVEAMRINSSANVGIGTAGGSGALSTRLHVRAINSIVTTIDRRGDFGPSLQFVRDDVAGSAALGLALDSALGVYTAGTERIRVTNGGLVQINTTSGAGWLNVNSSSGAASILLTNSANSNPFIQFANGAFIQGIGSGGSEDLRFRAGGTTGVLVFDTNSSERMRITSAGNVGVATTAPDTTFEVALSTTGLPGLRASRSGAQTQYIQMDIGQGASARLFATGGNKAMFITNNNTGAALGTATDSTFIQVPGPTANTPITAMYLESSTANVGIGTTTPAGRLHAVNSYTNSSDATIIAGGNIPGINLRASGGGRFSILSNFGATNTTSLAAATGTSNPAEVMRIDHASGAFIIGTGAPNAAAQLQVDSVLRGFLPPRMTTVQRDAITTPPDGLMLYNTTTNKLQVRAAGAWVDLH